MEIVPRGARRRPLIPNTDGGVQRVVNVVGALLSSVLGAVSLALLSSSPFSTLPSGHAMTTLGARLWYGDTNATECIGRPWTMVDIAWVLRPLSSKWQISS